MIVYASPYLNLRQIAASGQCFRMRETGDGVFEIISGTRFLRVCQQKDVCRFFCGEGEFEEYWKKYFDLETDYRVFLEKLIRKITICAGRQSGERESASCGRTFLR